MAVVEMEALKFQKILGCLILKKPVILMTDVTEHVARIK